MNLAEEKIFLVINLSFFGDVLLTNSLCQNIKKNYPESKVVFLVNKSFYEAAKYQTCVDDVICIDKNNEHKGFWGLYKFASKCKYKNKIDTAFIIYGNDRGILLSYLLNCKRRISGPTKFTKYLLTDLHVENDGFVNMQDVNGNFSQAVTGRKAEVLPIKFKPCCESDMFIQKLKKDFENQEVIALCTTSKNNAKDMPVDTAIEIIKRLNSRNKTVFYVGAGSEARSFADNIKKSGCLNFVDLTDATTINQLGAVLKMCKGLISVDTGTMHLACAVETPVVSVFYRTETIEKWAPRDFLYKSAVIDQDYSSDYICSVLDNLLAQKMTSLSS